ncbi:ImmA/IrrE family metallo-endopeptidase [Candidatus Saccharibacteria bacterium]|nr:ImmA/IrrE family metallo-endopeptidase [Candidatus Saccharibacteria bacterium]
MSKIKAIRTEKDYEEALALLEEILLLDPAPDSEEGDRLSILSTLLSAYEQKNFPKQLPSAIEAIRFRMDQLSLRPADLIPYIGSKSRVSEILSGKRQLTVSMIRALSEGLGIPSDSLLKQSQPFQESFFGDWDKKLFTIMRNRNYFADVQDDSEPSTILSSFFSAIEAPVAAPILLRQSSYRSAPTTDRKALFAWATQVLARAETEAIQQPFVPGSITIDFMRELAKLTTSEDSPVLAINALRQKGIAVIIEPELPKTRLDGAVLFTSTKAPVIGLTLRLDRLDNFWFTLMHELAHISLHSEHEDINFFFDELDGLKGMQVSAHEEDADRLASEALIPSVIWDISPAKFLPSPMAARKLAKTLSVHMAIVAGKIRYETGEWHILSNVVEEAKVRHFFPTYYRG